jgi:2-oxoglutarate dehydrogenase E1 component
MAPKSLLRHKEAVSPLEELVSGHFREMLQDPEPPEHARRLVLCSGKVFYDLLAARREREIRDVAIVRIEQFYPFNQELFGEAVAPFSDVEDVLWVQEETRNRGAWSYMSPILRDAFPEREPLYVGRAPSASPATGSMRVHREEQEQIIHQALVSGPTSAR